MKDIEQRFKSFLKDYKDSVLSIAEQIIIFKRIFGKKRETYYRWKKAVKNNKPLNHYNSKYSQQKEKMIPFCHFCGVKNSLLAHHRNMDREQNDLTNLLTLCYSCHKKLHDEIRYFSQFRQVKAIQINDIMGVKKK